MSGSLRAGPYPGNRMRVHGCQSRKTLTDWNPMQLSIEHGELREHACDLLILNLFKGVMKPGGATGAVDEALDGLISKLIKQERFEGNLGETLCFHTYGYLPAKKVCVLGLGEQKSFKKDTLRKVGGYVVKIAKEQKVTSVSTVLHGAGIARMDATVAAQALGEGMLLASYEFREHFGKGTNSKKHRRVDAVTIVEMDGKTVKAAHAGLEKASLLSEATALTRDLVNTSPRQMKPDDLAQSAKALAKRGNPIACKILDAQAMERMGMGAALAVAEGSVHPPKLIHLSYTPKKKAKKKIAVVGKGVTFDSGGLSLKPADAMTQMKIDMGGAATVLGLFRALEELELPIEVHGIVIAVENMPSGGAYRPGDVVRAMNGMTIEILNTDAEGRVTLADALSYTVKKVKPDEIVDLATLTGAVIIALGDDYAGLMSNNRTLAKSLVTAAKEAGELVWELPLAPQYDEAMKSKVADMNNTGGRSAGSIKAGLFLQRFVDKTPWAHLDIAGPVFCEKETRPDIPYGGTGMGVRTLVQYLEHAVS
ncbi:leucyl aminopeptidase [Candidatus Uhrbacteria bacterium]|nr:leucyl aminopeptidase [Candidatus Uhrbacteria bacterium]MBD3284485.1 leucyl aminopeptidase [Candidatus Uhrbacteria bacterium]